MSNFAPFRRELSSLRWLAASLPALALWTACRDVTAPEPRHTVDQTVAPSHTSVLGTLGGSVYYSLWPSEAVYRVDPNGGSSPVFVTHGAVVRVSPGGEKLAVVRNLDQALVTMNADGTHEHVLRTVGPAILGIAWSPDGKKVAAYTDGLDSPSLIYIYDDSTGASSTVTAPSRPLGDAAIDWRAGNWVIVRVDGAQLPNGNGFLNWAVPATTTAGSPDFADIYQATFFSGGSGVWTPSARAARLDSAGAVFWSGSNWSTNQFGIFNQGGSFRLNTGNTADFGFSPKGDAIAAIRQTSGSGVSFYNLDIIDWTGPYVRTLASSQFSGAGGDVMKSVDWSRPKEQKLIISSVTVAPDSIAVGDAFSIQVKLKNNGAVPLTAATPTLGLAPASLANITATPSPASKDLAPGDEATFTYTLSALATGDDTAIVNASASNGSATITAPVSRKTFSIGSAAGLTIDLHSDSTTVGINHDFTVTASITNHGSVAVLSTSATLTSDPSGGVTISSPVPSTPLLVLSHDATGDIKWTVRASHSGPLNFHVVASGHDDNVAAQVRTATQDLAVKVVDRRLVVTSTGDDSLSTEQLKDSVCDVDASAVDNQCTLRAAIQLANSFGGTQSVTFDITGHGVPTISPLAALPALTASVTLDATTQPGGWVQLSGSNTTQATGLRIDGTQSLIKGLVINHWRFGIAVNGSNNRISGNRIGTNASGTDSLQNEVGILVAGNHASIGGTTGTSATGCTGDCNLLSGNAEAVFVTDGSDVRIEGNWIGLDQTGLAALSNNVGVSVGGFEGGPGTPSGVHIGGPTTRPGLAPGNIISGNLHDGISVFAGSGTDVYGNLIGLDRTGNKAIYAGSATLSDVGVKVSNTPTGYVLVGDDAGRGNVIGGFHAGVEVSAASGVTVLVQQNLIGLTIDGTAAAPNEFGVIGNAEIDQAVATTQVLRNVISGNRSTGISLVDLVAGNKIGTNAAGTAAIPNRDAIYRGKKAGGVRPQGSTSCEFPCNLISGNKEGIALVDTVQGNFIGVDITGTHAIPNENVGVRNSAVIGGPSQALKGICDRACNLIAANDSAGIVSNVETTIQGNVIGATGLGNGRQGIMIEAYAANIGGDNDTGNAIHGNSGVAIESRVSAKSERPQIEGNSITGNGGGIAYSSQSSVSGPATPVVDSIVRSGTTTRFWGHLTDFLSSSSLSARVDVFGSTDCEPGPQGAVPIGYATVGLFANQRWSLDIIGIDSSLDVFTTTSTFDHATSSFSSCATARQPAKTSAAGSAGADRVELSSNTGFTVGGWAKLNEGGANSEWKNIIGFGSLIFSSPLTYSHAANEIVIPAAAPPPAGWLVSSGGDATGFGGTSSFSSAKAKSIVSAAATPDGAGVRMVSRGGVVYNAGNATTFGDASALLGKQEQAVSILDSHGGAGYWIITSKGRALAFGDAQSLASIASATSAGDIVAAAGTPSRNGYLMITACGAITTAGDAQAVTSVPAAKCDVIGATIPSNGHGAWILHANGQVDATGGAASLGSLTGRSGALAGIIAQGDGYIIAETSGKLYGFGTVAPAAPTVKGQATALVPLLR